MVIFIWLQWALLDLGLIFVAMSHFNVMSNKLYSKRAGFCDVLCTFLVPLRKGIDWFLCNWSWNLLCYFTAGAHISHVRIAAQKLKTRAIYMVCESYQHFALCQMMCALYMFVCVEKCDGTYNNSIFISSFHNIE